MTRVAATALLAMGLLHDPAAVAQDVRGSSEEQAESSAAGRAAAEQARAAAARQLQAAASEFTVVTIEPTQWSDSSLGCGKPNSMYTEVMSSGYAVVLERRGEQYQVNVAGSRAVMCEPNTRLSGTVRLPTAARGLDRVATLAREDLANRLHLDLQQIRVANVEPRRWTDDDMNCTSGAGAPAADAAGSASASGYRLTLSASGRTYFYHTDLRSVRACPPAQAQ
jgi:septal ring-binding cell division protein DamX